MVKSSREIYKEIRREREKHPSKLRWWKAILRKENQDLVRFEWLDHLWAIDDLLISEPYNVSSEEIIELQEFCKEYNLWYRLYGLGTHHDSTFQIILGITNESLYWVKKGEYDSHKKKKN